MPKITRRDFLGGVALSVAAGASLSPLEAAARKLLAPETVGAGGYPPALTGLRGAHPGSFEVAHDLARRGRRWEAPPDQTDATYDLVVVGGGLSGLAAAWFFREQAGPGARILILDNHDDFGGHAKRVEFDVDGRKLIAAGGSLTVAAPSSYPENAKRLLKELGFVPERFEQYFDLDFYARYMQPGIFFDGSRYGESKLVASPLGAMADYLGVKRSRDYEAIIRRFPVSEETRTKLITLFTAERDTVYRGLSSEGSLARANSQSYEAFLREEHGMTDEGCLLLRDYMKASASGLGLDSLSVLYASAFNHLPLPGASGLGSAGASALDESSGTGGTAEPTIHHFPGGNSGVARLIVRSLIPKSVPGSSMEDMVLARVDYGGLDAPDNAVRIRLDSTAVDVRHTQDEAAVDVTYVRGGKASRVRGKHVVMACYNHMLPHVCPEMEEGQKEALRYASKTPLVFAQVALRRWRAIEKGGYGQVYAPGAFVSEFWLDFPVSMGGYDFAKTPDDPIVITAYPTHTPDGSGLSAREQFRVSRHEMLTTPYEKYEKAILEQLGAIWGPYGMDPKRDVAAITVNRWPHGYAYGYNTLFDPEGYDAYADTGPHVTGRAQMNRISIANSDAGAVAMLEGAVEQAHRAVQEQRSIS